MKSLFRQGFEWPLPVTLRVCEQKLSFSEFASLSIKLIMALDFFVA